MDDQFCTFYVDNLLFGVPVSAVQEVIRYQAVTRVPLAPDLVEGLINLRGEIVTAIDVRERLGLPSRRDDRLPMNVVVQRKGEIVSLLVDEIGDVVDVDPQAYEEPPETVHGLGRELISGVYKLDTDLLLVLNTEQALAFEHLIAA